MSTNDIFGKTIPCECGKTHHIEPKRVFLSSDAVSEIPRALGDYCPSGTVGVLFDVRTREVVGREIVAALRDAGYEAHEILVPDPEEGSSPVCDDITRDELSASVPDVDAFISAGSGVICDLGKWLAFEKERPFAVFGTAASMNGYTSANVAPTVNGLKTLVRAKPPVFVCSSLEVLCDAPYEMTASGLGDILAKSASSTDWYINHLLFGDYYCARSVGLIEDIEPFYLRDPTKIHRRDPESISALFRGLLLTGAAMTMAETSSPSSG